MKALEWPQHFSHHKSINIFPGLWSDLANFQNHQNLYGYSCYLCNVSRPANKPRQWKSMLTHQGWFNLLIYATFTLTTNYRVRNLHIYLYPTPRRHITSPSEKSRPETWPGNYMGKATPVWQLTLSHRCHQI